MNRGFPPSIFLATIVTLMIISGVSSAAGDANCQHTGGELVLTYEAPSGPQNNIVFHIDDGGNLDCSDVFTFATGDLGIVGPVTLNRIEPDPTDCPEEPSCRHGWEKNPCINCDLQGVDGRGERGSFAATRYGGSFPQSIPAGTSVLKAVSMVSCDGPDECLQYAAVLTVVSSAPADPSNTFRTPYIGPTKPSNYLTFDDLDFSTWSVLDCSGVSDMPTFAEVARRFQEVQMGEYIGKDTNRGIHATDNDMGEAYHGSLSPTVGGAVMRMSCDDFDPYNDPDSRQAIINYVQYGYDLTWAFHLGYNWNTHSMGRHLPATVAAQLLGDADLITAIQNRAEGREYRMYYFSPVAGRALWGDSCTEDQYWNYYRGTGTTKNCRDPYGYIDGPLRYPNCCFNQGAYANAMGAIFSGVRTLYDREAMIDVAYRFYDFGYWGNPPDPCLAPSQGGGPNGTDCIRDPNPGTNPRLDDENLYCGSGCILVEHGGGTKNSGRWSSAIWRAFGENFKLEFFDCAYAGTCSGLNVGLDGPEPECQIDSDCTDDNLWCTGNETCQSGSCISSGDPCPGQICDEENDQCVDCLTHSDCDDSNPCTTDTCPDGTCSNTEPGCGPSDGCCPTGCDETNDNDCMVCTTSILDSWQNFPITTQNDTFTVEFDVIPNGSSLDGLTGLSQGACNAYADSAVTVRFNDVGEIDAWDNYADSPYSQDPGWYTSDTVIPYTAGNTYHFRLVIDVPNMRYSAYVTPQGSPTEQTIAGNNGFRNASGIITQLDNWHIQSGLGTHTVCNFRIGSYHRADKNQDGCIDPGEIGDFINMWYADSSDVSMVELVRALEIWKAPCQPI
jgi:hypothetical protein